MHLSDPIHTEGRLAVSESVGPAPSDWCAYCGELRCSCHALRFGDRHLGDPGAVKPLEKLGQLERSLLELRTESVRREAAALVTKEVTRAAAPRRLPRSARSDAEEVVR